MKVAMNEGQNARQQIVEKIKNSTNILVTVSADPSVDELSAAIGLTSMLNGLKKHTTAVVSGNVPPAITFLEPAKTFENTVDSLRDFIIALDKEKADHLRYKVEGDVVKIFITPYRTTITQDDLEFSQGDYNVELVLALGVKDKDNLDKALQAHGKIFHDATVATLSCGDAPSKLGDVNWHEPNASSISEMLVSVSEALKGDSPILDEQIATAFLTGIVAATDRFSNNKTSSKVMTMAAQLMAAGANQQLIAAKLEEAHEIGPDKDDSDDSDDERADGTTSLAEGASTKLSKEPKTKKKKKASTDGELSIAHEKTGTLDEVAAETTAENQAAAAKTAEDALAEQLSNVVPSASNTPSVSDLQQDLATASAEIEQAAAEPATPSSDAVLPKVVAADSDANEPSMGGTLNATAEQAHHDKEQEVATDRNKKILSHSKSSYVSSSDSPTFQSSFNAAGEEEKAQNQAVVEIFKDQAPVQPVEQPKSVQTPCPVEDSPAPVLPPIETLEDIDKKNRAKAHEEAQNAIALAYEETPAPATNPVEQAVQQAAPPPSAAPFSAPPSLPPVAPPTPAVDFSQLPPPPPLPPVPGASAPQGPVAPEQLGQIFGSSPSAPAPASNTPADPNQFKIPGQ